MSRHTGAHLRDLYSATLEAAAGRLPDGHVLHVVLSWRDRAVVVEVATTTTKRRGRPQRLQALAALTTTTSLEDVPATLDRLLRRLHRERVRATTAPRRPTP